MKRLILLLSFLLIPTIICAETLTLTSGKMIEGQIIERTDEYIKTDFQGSTLTFYLDEIASIDGKKIEMPSQELSAQEEYNFHEEAKLEIVTEADTPYEAEELYKAEEDAENFYQDADDIPAQPLQIIDETPEVVPEKFESLKSDLLESFPKKDHVKVHAKANEYNKGKVDKKPSLVFIMLQLLYYILIIASIWKIFIKAGYPGWAAIVPIYGFYVLIKVAGRPGFWLLLLFIPVISFVISIILAFDLAKNFGKGIGFGFGILFLGFIFIPLLAFSDAQYLQSEIK